MSLRPTALLILAGLLAIVAALRFRTAVHPEELSDPAPYEQFAAAAELVPSLRAVRVHTTDPDVGRSLRNASARAFRRVIVVEDIQAEMQRGRLAALSVEQLEEFKRRLKAGEIPRTLPPVPDARRYFRDALGTYPCEVLPRRAEGVDVIERALPHARLRGDPVLRKADEGRRAGVLRAAIAALVALVVAGLAVRSDAVTLEHRLLSVLVPLALLGWTGRGVDVWTLGSVALVAMAPVGSPLLAGAALLFFPAMTLQRMGIVFLSGGILRLWPRARGPIVVAGWRGWVAAGLVAIAGWFGLRAVPAPDGLAELPDREPGLLLVAKGTRSEAAEALRGEGLRDVVGGDELPRISSGDIASRRLLTSIYDLSKSRASKVEGPEREALEAIGRAAAREAVYVPFSLRRRRSASDGRDILWIHDRVDRDDERFVSHALYRERSEARLRSQCRLGSILVFALAVLLRVLRRRAHLLRDLGVALVTFVVGASWLFAGDAAGWGGTADPLLPTLALAGFAATWRFVFALAAIAVVLPGAFAVHLGAFVLAASLRYLAREDPASDLIIRHAADAYD